MQRSARIGTKTDDIAGIGRNFRVNEYNVKHDGERENESRRMMRRDISVFVVRLLVRMDLDLRAFLPFF